MCPHALFSQAQSHLMTFNIAEHFTGWLVELCTDNFQPNWTLFLKIFNLAEWKRFNL